MHPNSDPSVAHNNIPYYPNSGENDSSTASKIGLINKNDFNGNSENAFGGEFGKGGSYDGESKKLPNNGATINQENFYLRSNSRIKIAKSIPCKIPVIFCLIQ